MMALELRSSAFRDAEEIPRKYTGDGADISPPLSWTGIPEQTVSLAMICDDPDAPRGTWVHWVLFNLPQHLQALDENILPVGRLSNGARHGKNDFHKLGYGGPAPPPGKPHRYFFKLYALDCMLDIPEGSSRQDLLHAMEGHILAETSLMGQYQRFKA